MIKRWNADQILNEISKIYWAGTDMKMDGFSTWPCKQDMYRIKWAVDEMLSKMPTYSVEDEFLKEHNKELVWKALNETHTK